MSKNRSMAAKNAKAKKEMCKEYSKYNRVAMSTVRLTDSEKSHAFLWMNRPAYQVHRLQKKYVL